MESVQLRSMTRKQLVALAKRARIPRYSRMAKIQLIAALASARTSEVTELPANYGRTRLTLMDVKSSKFVFSVTISGVW